MTDAVDGLVFAAGRDRQYWHIRSIPWRTALDGGDHLPQHRGIRPTIARA